MESEGRRAYNNVNEQSLVLAFEGFDVAGGSLGAGAPGVGTRT